MIVEGKGRGGRQVIHRFENGYGASVITDGYGSDRGLFELGVIKFDGADSYHLTYETPITSDVLGYLTAEEVQENVDKIAALDPKDIVVESARRAIDEARAELERAAKTLAGALERFEKAVSL